METYYMKTAKEGDELFLGVAQSNIRLEFLNWAIDNGITKPRFIWQANDIKDVINASPKNHFYIHGLENDREYFYHFTSRELRVILSNQKLTDKTVFYDYSDPNNYVIIKPKDVISKLNNLFQK